MSSPERKLKLCVLPTCKGKRYDLVHKFPMNNDRAEQWIEIIDLPELRKLPIENVRKRFFVCSKHFRPQDYKNCESRSLNITAYPRLHLKVTDEESTGPLTVNSFTANVEESPVPVYEFVAQETTIEIDQSMPNVIKLEPKPTPAQLVVGPLPQNDVPIILRRNKIKKPDIILQKSPQLQSIAKPMGIKTNSKQILEQSITSNVIDSNKFIVKRSIDFTNYSPSCKKSRLNEMNVKKTYCNLSQINQQGLLSIVDTYVECMLKCFTIVPISDVSEEKSQMIEITHSELQNPLVICSFWLRDHCQCSICYSDTSLRKTNILDIPLDVTPTEVKVENNIIYVTCKYHGVISIDIYQIY